MKEPGNPLGMVCGVCRRSLAHHYKTDGTLDSWQHSTRDKNNGADSDHQPVPVPYQQIEQKDRCDFCSSDDVTHWIEVTDFPMTDSRKNGTREVRMSIGNWAACWPCTELIQARNWDQLATRATNTFGDYRDTAEQIAVRQRIRALYAELNRHMIGEPRALATTT